MDTITCGLPLGIKLGPIVFLAVINSLCRNATLHVKYVDDLTVAEFVDVKDRLHSQCKTH